MAEKKEMTRISVLQELLENEETIWKMCSKNYDTLQPMERMEDRWEEQREKVRILREIIQALKNDAVKKAMADFLEQEC